jgi:hypothetical protein
MADPHDKLPQLFRHMILGIYKKMSGTHAKRFVEAVAIAKHSMEINNLALASSLTGNLDRIRLTAEGQKRNAKHSKEPGRAAKDAEFKVLYAKYGNLVNPVETTAEKELGRKE